MKVGRGRRHADPGATPPATTGPAWVRAPWNAKAGKAGGALDRRVPSSGVRSGAPHPLTFGVAMSTEADHDLTKLMIAADEALYRAKAKGGTMSSRR